MIKGRVRGCEEREGEKMGREAGDGEGRKIGKIGREGKFPRAIHAPLREGRRETRCGKGDKGGGGGRATPCPPFANKNKIHQEYSGLRKGIHL